MESKWEIEASRRGRRLLTLVKVLTLLNLSVASAEILPLKNSNPSLSASICVSQSNDTQLTMEHTEHDSLRR